PKVIFKNINGIKSEPFETLTIDVPEEVSSKAINLVTMRKGDLHIMEPKGDLQHLEFDIPSRGLIGIRNKILTATQGEAIINHRLRGYDAFKGELNDVINGALVSAEGGRATAYSIDKLGDRGIFFIDINQEIYKGQVVGENNRKEDMGINLTKGKKLTNVRKSGTDTAVNIAPKKEFSLEECMEYIKDDEYLEVTPLNLRMRKIEFR
ncbi:MAG: translational GTPase TypA, partial [Flavobacteriaceae bacterium]|nr:translational GTPase TypA [Flavobacteriaceae bacterium]